MDRIFIVVPPKPSPPLRPTPSPYNPPPRKGMGPAEFLGCLGVMFIAGMCCMSFVVWVRNHNPPMNMSTSGPGLPPPLVSGAGSGVDGPTDNRDPVRRRNP